MIEIIQNIFQSNQFKSNDFDNGIFYIPNKERNAEEYWLVIRENIEHILSLQEKLFKDCKSLCSDAAVDKNLSMLILWETDGSVPTDELKENIIRSEEDPYLFKKYVLYYSKKEVEELKKEAANDGVVKFIKEKIVSREVFDVYKEEPYIQTWQSLLFRLAIKIPFLPIAIEESKGLQSLFETNENNVEENNLTQFNNSLTEKINNLRDKEIKDMPALELFNELHLLIGENTSDD